jgi:D-alanine transaminase
MEIMTLVMINGNIVDGSEAKISAWDRGVFFGDGVYEVIQGYAGKLWGFEQHFARFVRSLHEIRIDNVDVAKIREWVLRAFSAANIPYSLVYFHITRGCGMRSHVPGEDLGEPNFFLYVKPAPDNSKRIEHGITAITCPDIRWKRCDIKTLNLLPNVMASQEANKLGAEEAIFVADDAVTEGASSCFFCISGNTLLTRPLGHEILPSVTRQAILAIAERLNFEIIERSVMLKESLSADELFVSSSGYEIRPIVKLDKTVIGSGKPGRKTRQIIDEFLRVTRGGISFDEVVKNTRFQLLPER